jgi:hypothetical protein
MPRYDDFGNQCNHLTTAGMERRRRNGHVRAMLIASEFMPVSLLTPIAADLGATEEMAGQAISISGSSPGTRPH